MNEKGIIGFLLTEDEKQIAALKREISALRQEVTQQKDINNRLDGFIANKNAYIQRLEDQVKALKRRGGKDVAISQREAGRIVEQIRKEG